ncbi:hypothetical protein QAD02_015093, partial [Eretmocerus hayati]
ATWNALLDLAEKYYPLYQFQFFWRNFVIIRHPDDVKILLSCKDNITKGNLAYDNMRHLGLDGVIMSGGQKWATRRKMLNPAFSQAIMKIYAALDEDHADRFIEELRSGDQVQIRSIFPMFHQYSLGISFEAILGLDVHDVAPKDRDRFADAVKSLTDISFFRAARPFLANWMMPFLSEGRKQYRLTKWAKEWMSEILTERRKSMRNEVLLRYQDSFEDTDTLLHGTKGKKKMAVIDLLLEAQEKNAIDESGVHEELLIFLSGGYESTGVFLSFMLLIFAENKQIQDRARSEVLAVTNEGGGKMTESGIQKLDYLERCLQEVLRIYPSIPLIGRTLDTDLNLKNYVVPAGTEVFIHLVALHRDPNFWPDPLRFDPDRFLPGAVHERHPFAYSPFSAGLRNCIGRKFAMLGAKMAISKVLQNFYIEQVDPRDKMEFKFTLPLQPIEPMHVKFIRIDQN